MKVIDLRSDTVTQPTPAMRRAMYEAEVGDDVFHEDPTVNRLEELAAGLLGQEAALFCTSGTQGNQVGIAVHTSRGGEVIAEAESHVYLYEVGGIAAISQCQVMPVRGRAGVMAPADVQAQIRPANVHFPRTQLICVENTHNRAGGTVVPQAVLDDLCAVAHAAGVPVHLDGARLFNAAVAQGIPAARIARPVDSVQVCLSKGLGAPVGSVLAGPADYVAEARRYRKMFGGGMRQAGLIAAAGIVALTEMVDRLADDHENARVLAAGVSQIPGLEVELTSVQTNMVYFNVVDERWDGANLAAALDRVGVRCVFTGPCRIRLVTHKDVNRADIDTALVRLQATVTTGPGPAGGAGSRRS